jgi:exonuclease V
MASPAPVAIVEGAMSDGDTDYGSDFSPEEAQIVERLIAGQVAIEDNPIVNEVEYHGAERTLRLPHILGREQKSPLFEAARAAEEVAQHISNSVKSNEHYPDCKFPWIGTHLYLTDVEASSEQPN